MTRLADTRTERDPHDDDGLDVGAHLYRVLSCEDPLGGGARHRLDGEQGVDVVSIGRGEVASIERTVERGLRRLVLRVPDPWLSRAHAEVVRAGRSFVLVDAGSKNGTRKNGAPVTRASLDDGDWIEAGHTFFRFRAAVATRPEAPVDEARADAATLVPSFERELGRVEAAARSSTPVVILGESGTGKERIARAVHRLSGRGGAFVAVNCGALPDELVESELFGYRRGAFSGAREAHPGLVRAADGGTLFLDEIGDLPLGSQAAFLRVLQEGEVRPIGATEAVRVDVRVVSATHRDIARLVDEGAFRADLRARLDGVTVTLPPLRERIEDLGLLVAQLLRAAGPARDGLAFTRDATAALVRHGWPLNVRELERCVAGAVALTPPGKPVGLDALPVEVRRALAIEGPGGAAPPPDESALTDEDRARRDRLVALLGEHAGNLAAVARAFGKGRFQIHRWLRRYGIDPEKYRR